MLFVLVFVPQFTISIQPSRNFDLTSVFRFCISANTTCPATQQCTAIYRLSDEDIEAVLALQYGTEVLQCPARVQMAIFHISKLRLSACESLTARREIHDEIQCIADELYNVDVEAWVRETFADADEAATAAKVVDVMVVAARLYGILALPKTCAAAWLAASPTERETASSGVRGQLDAYNRARAGHRERFLKLLRAAEKNLVEPLACQGGVAWALLVAGVAASDGSKESRQFISHTLTSISQGPIASLCFRASVEGLDAIWRRS